MMLLQQLMFANKKNNMTQNKAFLPALSFMTVFSGFAAKPLKSEKPNILIIVADDLAFSDLGSFGGEINTPNLDELAGKGTRYTRFHTSSLSAPTRSMLLTGVDNHQNGLGAMPPLHSLEQYMEAGYEGYLNNRVVTLSEQLKQNGYYTMMSGKWHLGHKRGTLPVDRGFDQSFALAGGGASYFSDALPLSPQEAPVTIYYENENLVDSLPEDFYATTYYTDKMLSYLNQSPDDTPFFAYLAFTAPHDPLQVKEGWEDKYKQKYDAGYEEIRKARFNKQKDLGIIDKNTQYHTNNKLAEKWEQLSEQEKLKQSRKMEIYASMVEYMDYSIGRVVQYLEESGKADNTLIIFMSDNGSNPKDPEFYYFDKPELFENVYDNSIENYGKRGSFISLGKSWAEVGSTPYSYYKTSTREGGITTPLIISGKGFDISGIDNENFIHVADIYPTVLEYANDQSIREKTLAPLYGKSIYNKECIRGDEEAVCFEMLGSKAVVKGNWKAVFENPPLSDGTWKLYNLEEDIAEQYNLSARHPEKLTELIGLWRDYAKQVGHIEFNQTMILNEIGPDKFYEYDPNLKKELKRKK